MTQQCHYFGTDGIRGKANAHPMTADFALKLAYACSSVLGNGKRSSVVIGKDTRLSGYMLEQALTAGFVAMGVDVKLLGPIPTPAVAILTQKLGCDFGIVISASHNPYEDNGIKLIGPDGMKLSDAQERAIEDAIDKDPHLAQGTDLGKAVRVEDALAQYEHALLQDLAANATLEGLKIVVDCANGAAYRAAPHLLRQLRADLIVLANEPDGMNINKDCGATHLDMLRDTVKREKADLGIALDGDADRVMLVDENGDTLDGDQILAVLADDLPAGVPVVSTLMGNLGLERHLKSKGRAMIRANVGDRYVIEAMTKDKLPLGGEQSGHIIFGGSTTGDGLRTALHMALHLKNEGGRASQTLRRFKQLPQLLQNVKAPKSLLPQLEPAIKQAETRLGDKGRLLVRASGTEPLIRVMAEGDDAALIESVVGDLCAEIERQAAQKAA